MLRDRLKQLLLPCFSFRFTNYSTSNAMSSAWSALTSSAATEHGTGPLLQSTAGANIICSRPCTVQSWLKALKNKNILLAPDVVHQHFYGAGRDRWILQWHHETHSPVVDHTVFKITDTSHARWLYCDVSKTNPQSIVRAREDITEFVSVDADEPLNFFQLGYVGRDRGPECNLALILCAFGADRGLLPGQAQPALGAGADLTAADRSGSPSPNGTLHVDEDH